MTDLDQKQLGKTLGNIADTPRGAMNADDFRDYMLSFVGVVRGQPRRRGGVREADTPPGALRHRPAIPGRMAS